MPPRDNQRSKVYRAERRVSKGVQFSTVSEMQGYVDQLCASRWWHNRFPDVQDITVKDGRGRRNAAGWNGRCGTGYVAMPRWSRCERVLFHEVAHVVTPGCYAWHGREFVRNFLALVDRWMGKEVARLLRESFSEYKVKWYRLASSSRKVGRDG